MRATESVIPQDAVFAAFILPRLTKLVEAVITYGREADPDNWADPQRPRGGGYVCFRPVLNIQSHLPTKVPTFVGMVRVSSLITHPDAMTPERWDMTHGFCQEKCARLAKFAPEGHVSSYQSRDESAQQYGGGVVVQNWAMAFSGLPEEGDQAVMLALALGEGWIKMPEAQRIAQHGDGHFFTGFVKCLRTEGLLLFYQV